jgi:hypothetical protein
MNHKSQSNNQRSTKAMKVIVLSSILIALATGFSASLVAQENHTRAVASPTRAFEKLISVTATVEAIDLSKREVTLKGPLGNLVTLEVSDQVRRFNKIKVGDQVAAAYYIGIVAELRPPTEEEKEQPFVVLKDSDRATTGAPAGSGARLIRAVTTVEGLDRPSMTATLKGPAGRYLTVHVSDPKVLEKLRIGDTVVVTCAQALAVSIKKAKVSGKE